MNVWIDPNKTLGPLGHYSGITLILLDCPPRSSNPARAGVIRNWRLLRAFAEASGTPVRRLRKSCKLLKEPLRLKEAGRGSHLLVAGSAGENEMLPILLEAALRDVRISIIYDAFLDGRARRSGTMPVTSRRPLGNAPLYVGTGHVLAGMLMQQDVDEAAP